MNHRLLPILSFIILLLAASCDSNTGPTLVWEDDFETDGLPSTARWNYEEGFIRNEESQFYTSKRSENARQENGLLILEARREPWPNPAHVPGSTDWRTARDYAFYTSASLTTKATWKYGRIEVRAKIPTGVGMWPAIWMLGTNIGTVGWPKCGEIDIMENVGFDPDVIHANIHTAAYNHTIGTNKGNRITVPRPYDRFHVYAVDWNMDRMDFFVDDSLYFSFANEGTGVDTWPFDQEFYLILNIAVGGAWGGQQGIDDAIFPQRMEIDYVRVYQ
jgi:beta-glucanase (GH16 family)